VWILAECKVTCADPGEDLRFTKDAKLLERVKEEVESALQHTLEYYKNKIELSSPQGIPLTHTTQMKVDRTLSGIVDFRPREATSPSSIAFDCTPSTCAVEGEIALPKKHGYIGAKSKEELKLTVGVKH